MTKERISYQRKDLVRLAQRDNNAKRPFLLVNPLQGKHIPCSPGGALALFGRLASRLYDNCKDERLLIIGFAETATAIGAAIAACAPDRTDYIQTTRETIEGTDSLFFSEVHSHATEQKLIKTNLRSMLERANRVVFAEDEVTTGNTILNAIDAVQKEYGPLPLKFGVVSILNGMSEKNMETFRLRGISCTWLLRLENESYRDHLASYEYDPALRFTPDPNALSEDVLRALLPAAESGGLALRDYCNPRLGGGMNTLLDSCRLMTEKAAASLDPDELRGKDVLVLGTEEFMFPPLLLAAYLEAQSGCRSVRFHATTRSPILPCGRDDYPITSRFSLRSVYDASRPTFIYNLNRYDKVVIVHDSQADYAPGLLDLCAALSQRGCGDISIFRWSADETAADRGGAK